MLFSCVSPIDLEPRVSVANTKTQGDFMQWPPMLDSPSVHLSKYKWHLILQQDNAGVSTLNAGCWTGLGQFL